MSSTIKKTRRYRFKPLVSGLSSLQWRFYEKEVAPIKSFISSRRKILNDKLREICVDFEEKYNLKEINKSFENRYHTHHDANNLTYDNPNNYSKFENSYCDMEVSELIDNAYSRIKNNNSKIVHLRNKSFQLKQAQDSMQSIYEIIKPSIAKSSQGKYKAISRPRIIRSDYNSDLVLPIVNNNEFMNRRYSKGIKRLEYEKKIPIMRPLFRIDLMNIENGSLSPRAMRKTWIKWNNISNINKHKEKFNKIEPTDDRIEDLCTDIKGILYNTNLPRYKPLNK